MFSVRVCICTDGDFGYDEPEFNIKDNEEKIFYFENREDAANSLIQSFHNIKKSLRPCRMINIKKWIDSMDNRVELIAKKFFTFTIEKNFGNQYIIYELLETEQIKIENGSYYFKSTNSDINFSWYEEEKIRWDELINYPDIN